MNAHIRAAEVAQQTHTIIFPVSSSYNKISESVSFAVDQISEAIDILDDRICIYLSEIRWQLIQQNETLEKCIDVLSEGRNHEVQKLVRLSVRHYVNVKYGEEKRFIRSLDSDNTDSPVLMYLRYRNSYT